MKRSDGSSHVVHEHEQRFRQALRHAATLLLALCTAGCGSSRSAANPPPVEVAVAAALPGAKAAEVEVQLTQPLEEALNALPAVRHLTSASRQGGAELRVTFDPVTPADAARLAVQEQLKTVLTRLPPGALPPTVSTPHTAEVLRYSLASEVASRIELRALHEEQVRLALLQVPGVAGVSTFGGAEAQVEVLVDAERLSALNFGLKDVLRIVSSGLEPLAAVAAKRLGERGGVPVLLSHVANVALSARVLTLAAHDGRSRVVAGVVSLASGADPQAVLAAVTAKLDAVRPTLPAGAELAVLKSAHFVVRTRLPSGLTLEKQAVAMERVHELVARSPEVQSALTTLDGPELDVAVELKPGSARGPEALLRALAQQQPDVALVRVVPLRKELEPWRATELTLRGPELEALARSAQERVERLRATAGVVAVAIEGLERGIELSVVPDPDALARHGLSTSDVATAVQVASDGVPAGRGVVVRVAGFRDPEALGSMWVAPGVALSQVARFEPVEAPRAILHDGRERCVRIVVTAPGVTQLP